MIEKKQKAVEVVNTNINNEEMRAVYFSYLELEKYIKNKTEEESKKNIIKVLDNLKDNKFNTIIVHVRPFSDAIYKSDIFPFSETVKVNGQNPSYDILKYIITQAHKRNIAVHAWINPYRISTDTNTDRLSSLAQTFYKNKDAKVVNGKGIYYDPSSDNTNKLILSGIKELLNNYEIDGIHFDDYFYPSKDIDLDNYKKYIDNGGNLSLEDFRYDIILNLIKDVYWTIKSINPNVLFGISPEGNINNNYDNHFLDVKKILSEKGYIDYIMPQIYFGFNNSNRPFIRTLNEWTSFIKNDIKLIPALAFYKSGEYDKYAGSGDNEWISNDNIISRQIEESKPTNYYGGFSIFRYDSIFSPNNNNKKNEFINLKHLLE